jgi:hypothetical protein
VEFHARVQQVSGTGRGEASSQVRVGGEMPLQRCGRQQMNGQTNGVGGDTTSEVWSISKDGVG